MVQKHGSDIHTFQLDQLCAKQGWPLNTDKNYAENQISFLRAKNE